MHSEAMDAVILEGSENTELFTSLLIESLIDNYTVQAIYSRNSDVVHLVQV
jgi:hypothetical protein